MVLHVQYRNKSYDYVSDMVIDKLIRQKWIAVFYRPSEKKWVDVEHDPLRGGSDVYYIGPERRNLPAVA
jgi:hypothetical protein